jgi:hypothetical protein
MLPTNLKSNHWLHLDGSERHNPGTLALAPGSFGDTTSTLDQTRWQVLVGVEVSWQVQHQRAEEEEHESVQAVIFS